MKRHLASGRRGDDRNHTPDLTDFGLINWIDNPSEVKGLAFANDDDSWDFFNYAALAVRSKQFAAWMQHEEVSPGLPIPIIVPTGKDFVAAFYGALLAGGTPSPLVPPFLFEDLGDWAAHVATLVEGRHAIVTTTELKDVVERAAGMTESKPRVLTIPDHLPSPAELKRAERAGHALLQFTSGSSGTPRGVQVTWSNLEKMVEYIFRWIPAGPDDSGCHWLPMYHDFGLIGGMLAPVTSQRDCWIMRPEQFVMRPERWINRFGRHGATFTAAPGFALGYVLKKVDPSFFEGCDFSNWKGAVLGAERLDPALLERFAEALEPYGFRREVFMPGYGMAETTLGVCGVIDNEIPTVVKPDWSTLSFGESVDVLESNPLGPMHLDDGGNSLMCCGFPHRGNMISIVDEDFEPLADGTLGEIFVSGPTVTDGYERNRESAAADFVDGGVRTGDAGFVHEGELFIVGRLGDSVKVRGRNVFAEDIETKLQAIPGVPKGRVVVLPGIAEDGQVRVAVVVEGPDASWLEPLTALLERELSDVQLEIYRASPGAIMRTSSGKPRRREMWVKLLDGELEISAVGNRLTATQ